MVDGVCVFTHIVQCHTKLSSFSQFSGKRKSNEKGDWKWRELPYNLKLLLLLGNSSSKTIFSHFEIIMAHINQLKPHILRLSLYISLLFLVILSPLCRLSLKHFIFSMSLYSLVCAFTHTHLNWSFWSHNTAIFFGSMLFNAHLPLCVYHRSRHIILIFPILLRLFFKRKKK